MHLLAAISAHGYGHLMQVGPVLGALAARQPALRVTVRSALPEAVLRTRLPLPFAYTPFHCDIGMVMSDAVSVLVTESLEAHRGFHHDWEAKVEQEARALRALAPDLILADVPYLTLAAARRAGIPAAALCSLNWADIFGHYCAHLPGGMEIEAAMRAAYRSAKLFLRPEPSMPMGDLPNGRSIAPIAREGRERRTELAVGAEEQLVLVALGGIPTRLPVERWPRIPGVRWLLPHEWGVRRADFTPFDAREMSVSDLIRSCDAVIAKSGYSTFAEAAVNGAPVLYLPRPDWPEAPWLNRWLEAHGRALPIAPQQLESGVLGEALERLWALPPRPLVAPGGAAQAAELLLAL